MSIDERVANLEQAFLALNTLAKKQDERHESTSENIRLLTEMIRRHDEKLDDVRAEQSNADIRIAALADAQIRTEDSITRTNEAIAALTERVDHLTVLVERIIERNGDKA